MIPMRGGGGGGGELLADIACSNSPRASPSYALIFSDSAFKAGREEARSAIDPRLNFAWSGVGSHSGR
jgi:hypothetical protein